MLTGKGDDQTQYRREEGDLSRYKDKETLLSGIRQDNLAKQRRNDSQNLGRNPNLGQIIRGSVPGSDTDDRTVEAERPGTPQPVYGGNAGQSNGTGGSSRFASQLRSVRSELAGGDSSTYQSERPAGRERPDWRVGVKQTYAKYKEAFKSDKPKSTTPKAAPTGKRITDAEAIKLRPKLVEFVLWQSEHLDQFIIATTRGHDQDIEIWSDISRDEAEIIVDFLLARGKQDVRTAIVIRQASVFIDRLKLFIIIGPRMYRSMMIYLERGVSIS